MQATKVMANLRVADIEAAKGFYTDYLGLSDEQFNTRSFRSAPMTSTVPTPKPKNSATKSCIH